MEFDSMASAIREIPFRLMSREQGFEENPFIEGIYASLVGQLFLGFNCEANFNIIATLMFDRDQKKINTFVKERLISTIQTHNHARVRGHNGVKLYLWMLQKDPLLALEILSDIKPSGFDHNYMEYINTSSLYYDHGYGNLFTHIVDYCMETDFSVDNLFRMFLEEDAIKNNF